MTSEPKPSQLAAERAAELADQLQIRIELRTWLCHMRCSTKASCAASSLVQNSRPTPSDPSIRSTNYTKTCKGLVSAVYRRQFQQEGAFLSTSIHFSISTHTYKIISISFQGSQTKQAVRLRDGTTLRPRTEMSPGSPRPAPTSQSTMSSAGGHAAARRSAAGGCFLFYQNN